MNRHWGMRAVVAAMLLVAGACAPAGSPSSGTGGKGSGGSSAGSGGATATEYALLIALVAGLSIAVWTGIGDSLAKIFQ